MLDADIATGDGSGRGFQVRLADFEGPFDLLLHLISKHKLEVTELALHAVTDEFISYIGDQKGQWDLDEATSFLVIAATLLDLKSARLLPSGEVEDEEDLAVLEARDLLFARLLQYKAFKQASTWLAEQFTAGLLRHSRNAPLEEPFGNLLPELLFSIGPEQLSLLAGKALSPKPVPEVSTGHLHAPLVSVREQAILIAERLRRRGVMTFRALTQDADSTSVIVARFLALLELYRDRVVSFEQSAALGELQIRWMQEAEFDPDVLVSDEFDAEETEDV